MGASEDHAAWDRVAAAYVEMVGRGADSIYTRFEPFLWRHLGADLPGLRVLDLGCGHGWLAETCRVRGAIVVGVDGSKLLRVARTRYPEVSFEHADLSEGLPESVASLTFDRVVAHMVLMDVPRIEALAASLSRCLAVDGVVVVTLTHPSFFMQSPTQDPSTGEWYRVRGYLEHEEWWIDSFGGHRHYHRPLEFYTDWLASAGLGVIGVSEPPVPPSKPREAWDERDRWSVTIPTMIGLQPCPCAAEFGRLVAFRWTIARLVERPRPRRDHRCGHARRPDVSASAGLQLSPGIRGREATLPLAPKSRTTGKHRKRCP